MESKKILESFIEGQNYSSVFTSQKVAIKSLLKNQESPAFFLPLSHLTGTSSPFSIPSSLFSQLRLPVCKQLLCLALKASEVFVLFFLASEKRARQVEALRWKKQIFQNANYKNSFCSHIKSHLLLPSNEVVPSGRAGGLLFLFIPPVLAHPS